MQYHKYYTCNGLTTEYHNPNINQYTFINNFIKINDL